MNKKPVQHAMTFEQLREERIAELKKLYQDGKTEEIKKMVDDVRKHKIHLKEFLEECELNDRKRRIIHEQEVSDLIDSEFNDSE